jgi:hypothetical protein
MQLTTTDSRIFRHKKNTTARTKTSMPSLGVAWQWLLNFRVQRPPSSLADVYLPTDNSRPKSHYDWRSVGQPVLVSNPIWGPIPDFCYCQTFAVLWMKGALSDERTGQLTIVRVSHVTTDGQSVSPSWCRAPFGAHDQILITVWQLLFCRCRAPPLTRGRVCHLS